jgi:uncharacterized protein YjbI with pentapeptide repeats
MAKLNLKNRMDQVWKACKHFLAKWWRWGVLVLVLLALALAGYWGSWTGFDGYYNAEKEWQRGKTLWDWLDLLLVPALLAIGAWLLNRAARERENRIELDRSREAALQTYLDRMTELIKDGICESELDDARRSIAQARTLTVLRQMDGERKGLLARFLHDSRLITMDVKLEGVDDLWCTLSSVPVPTVSLQGANFRGAILSGANLTKASLADADLSGADLRGADLTGADLSRANLKGAKLTKAVLGWASLIEADLRGANLQGASIYHACLHKAKLDSTTKVSERFRLLTEISSTTYRPPSPGQDSPVPEARNLRGANLRYSCLARADLRGADLREANASLVNFRYANLVEADLRGATLNASFRDAKLCRGNLVDADLRQATLDGADLTGAKVSDEQLRQVFSKSGMIMPNGKKLK